MTVVLVASSGGHLDELVELADRFSPPSKRVWITPDTPHARSLLHGETIVAVPSIGARQARRAAVAFPMAWNLMHTLCPSLVLTTGAALCVPYVLAARLQRREVRFIDSATRLRGPSLTGRLLRRVPGVDLYYQSTGWAQPWQPTTNLFDGFATSLHECGTVRRVVVTLGTERFPFPRAVKAIADALPDGAEVFWQLGHTPAPDGLTGTVHDFVPYADLEEQVRQADTVVTHAGVGSMLTALRSGRSPVVLARSARHGEHIDDHQAELASMLSTTGLVQVAAFDNAREALARAARLRVRRSSAS